jgi:phospholipid/cholesterol/gamma-HCH transport system substrate-binding protein
LYSLHPEATAITNTRSYMKFTKEAQVGLLGIVTIAVFYLGFNFLKGLDVFSTVNEYRVTFSDVMGLQNSNDITYKGVSIGRVTKIETDQENEQINVTLAINKSIKVTDNTTAYLADDGLIGGKLIKLNVLPGNPLPEGAQLKGEVELGLADAAIQKITPALNDIDSLVSSLNRVINQFDNTGTTLKALMISANRTTDGVNAVLASNQANLVKITTNAALLTDNLNNLTLSLDSKMSPILSNTERFTDNLNALELEKTVNNLNSSISGLQEILSTINKGEGTLGKLTSDDSLYVNLDRTAASLDALLSDLKANPNRYVHFSLFGRKEKTERKK